MLFYTIALRIIIVLIIHLYLCFKNMTTHILKKDKEFDLKWKKTSAATFNLRETKISGNNRKCHLSTDKLYPFFNYYYYCEKQTTNQPRQIHQSKHSTRALWQPASWRTPTLADTAWTSLRGWNEWFCQLWAANVRNWDSCAVAACNSPSQVSRWSFFHLR